MSSDLMPVLFVGHGSPMNAIEDNDFSRTWTEVGRSLPRPHAILCISAHWNGTFGPRVTAMERPRTIHDFYGFPQELFAVEYPAPGSSELAETVANLVGKNLYTDLDMDWGLDHGCWSVLMRMFPQADIPVVQLSLDGAMPPDGHYSELAYPLLELREQGVLVIGSGNMVHNLGMIDWRGGAYDWALSFDQRLKTWIEQGDHDALIHYEKHGREAALSIPTEEHYLPLLYVLALQQPGEQVQFFNEQVIMGSISMRSLRIG